MGFAEDARETHQLIEQAVIAERKAIKQRISELYKVAKHDEDFVAKLYEAGFLRFGEEQQP